VKFDKETIIAMVICIAALMLWPKISDHLFPPPPKPKIVATQQPTESVAKGQEQVEVSQQAKNTAISLQKKKAEPKPENLLKELPVHYLSSKDMTVAINPNTGSISSIELKDFKSDDKKNYVTLDKDLKPGALAVRSDSKWIPLNIASKAPSPESFEVVRQFKKEDGQFDLTQIWKLTDQYTTDYQVEIKNTGSSSVTFDGFNISAGGMAPLANLAGDKSRRDIHGIEYFLTGDNHLKLVEANTNETESAEKNFQAQQTNASLNWLSVSNKYFACILFPEKPFDNGNMASREIISMATPSEPGFFTKMFGFGGSSETQTKYCVLSSAGRYKPFIIKPGSSKTFKLRYYSGPKKISFLSKFNPATTKTMHIFYIWTWPVFNLLGAVLEWLSQALLAALVYFKSLTGSYGVGIIILTIIVRAAVWPFTQKANNSMRKMQKIQPLVQEIRGKYKDNPQVMNQKVMALYKENKVNPLGGCLPIALQMPVFLALFCAFSGAVELRHASFLWCKDLCQPDNIGSILGIPIHPLVLAMTLLMVLQQKMTPSAADPAQQKMMMFMPLVMLLFFYDMPSGLTLYWTVSQSIAIIQLLINKQVTKRDEEKAGATA